MALIGRDDSHKIWNFLIQHGCTPHGAAAAMGNLYAESGLHSNNLQNSYNTALGYTDASYTAAVDNGTYENFENDLAGYGLAQWTYPARKKALLNLARSKDVSIADIETQLEYLWSELQTSYKTVLAALKSATSVKAASDVFMVKFESPADQSDSAKTKRANYGMGYYNSMVGSSTNEGKENYNMSVADKVLSQLAALAGESEVASNNIVTVTKYYNAQGQPYCGYSIKYAFEKAGYSSIIKGCSNPAYVPTIRQWMDSEGWRVSNSSAKAGDIFVYGSDDHVGFVYQPYSGTTVITLEGNSKVYATLSEAKSSTAGTGSFEGIGYKKRNLGSSFKLYRPAYDGASASSSAASTSSISSTAKTHIAKFQQWLKSEYGAAISVDGVYGAMTKKAAVTAYQEFMNKTYNTGLEVDGVFGSGCRAALAGRSVKMGSSDDLVKILQGVLYSLGYNPNGLDGVFGSGSKAAVVQFQKDRGLSADGCAGMDTFYAMLS